MPACDRGVQVVTTEDEEEAIVAWTNTGFLDSDTNGSYAFADIDKWPTDTEDGFAGLMFDSALSRIYVSGPYSKVLVFFHGECHHCPPHM